MKNVPWYWGQVTDLLLLRGRIMRRLSLLYLHAHSRAHTSWVILVMRLALQVDRPAFSSRSLTYDLTSPLGDVVYSSAKQGS